MKRFLLLALLICPLVTLAAEIHLHAVNSKSRRMAVMEDDGKVAYLYLTQPGSTNPVRDAIAYSRVPLIAKMDWKKQKESGEQPQLSADVASKHAVIEAPEPGEFRFRWSDDGQSVALMRNGAPIAMASMRERLGFSKAVAKPSPLANPWNEKRFGEWFGKEPAAAASAPK